MKSSFVAALGAAGIVTLGASPAAQAGTVDFGVMALSDSITYTGTSLLVSTALDLDNALLLVTSVGSGDESGLTPFVSTFPRPASPPATSCMARRPGHHGGGDRSRPETP